MKFHKIFLKYIIAYCLLIYVHMNINAQPGVTTIIKGIVIDDQTNDPLPFAGVLLEGTKLSTNTDTLGKFVFQTSLAVKRIKVVSVGYETTFILVKPGQTQNVTIRMKPNVKEINEVIVVPKKKRYRNKNNPAVELIEKVINHKDANRKENLSYLEYEKYEKVTFALSNISERFKHRKIFRKFQFVFDNIDTTKLLGAEIMPIYLKETLTKSYNRKTPAANKDSIEANKMVNFNGNIDNKGISEYLKFLYQDIDIYINNITFLTNPFLSPIAATAPAFYKYYIMDTLDIAEVRCVKLSFAPRTKTDMLFQGFMYITLDSTYAVKRIEMSVNKDINLNWVKSVSIQQEFNKIENQGWLLSRDDLSVDFGITQNKMGVFGERVVSYNNYKINHPLPDKFYATKEEFRLKDKEIKDENFWKVHRHEPLTKSEEGIYTIMDSIQHIRIFRRTVEVFTFLFAGFKDFGYFEIGPVNTFYSYNPIEGLRLRFGGRTTPRLSQKLTFETYGAYGLNDQKYKYYLGTTYSLSTRNIYEFPVKSIKVSIQNDTKIPGQDLQFVQEDNILLSIKRGVNDKLFYNKKFMIEHLNEFSNHFSYTIGYGFTRQSPSGSLFFTNGNADLHVNTIPWIDISEVSLNLRYAPHEQFYQGKIYRASFASKYPVYQLQYTVGSKLIGNDFTYHNLRLTLSKRFYWPLLGYTDISLEGGKIFGKVPYPLLDIHRANQTYSYQILSYNLMNFLEFVSDQYGSLNFDHCFNGFFFNRIPVLKRLKFREVVTCKVLYGNLTSQNNPNLHPDLFKFPADADRNPLTFTLDKKPYVEVSAGISNIFKLFRVDMVQRLTYLDHPHVSATGVRVRFKMDF